MSVTRAYSPYGQHENKGAHAVPGFNGQRYDPLSHTYALGQGLRYYSPSLMRFQAADSSSPFEKGGINTYAYCNGDPVNYSDPTGRTRMFGVLQRMLRPSSGKSHTAFIPQGHNKTVAFSHWVVIDDPQPFTNRQFTTQTPLIPRSMMRSARSAENRTPTSSQPAPEGLPSGYKILLDTYKENNQVLNRALSYLKYKENNNQPVTLENLDRISIIQHRHETLRKLFYSYHAANDHSTFRRN